MRYLGGKILVTFAADLQNCLRARTTRASNEFAAGQSLEDVLGRHLLAVESMSDTVLLTSVLLLDPARRRLWHAAAPSLPRSYCDAINGAEIGPTAGSCGTAAFEDRPIYVTDIATDPLWTDYRHLALPHGLRACWSTPIYDSRGALVGTFAVYHLTPRSPTREEVEALRMITGHVAKAIMEFRDPRAAFASPNVEGSRPTVLRPVPAADEGNEVARWFEAREILKSVEADFKTLADVIGRSIEALPDADRQRLRRAKQAAERGAALARKGIESE